MKIQHIGFFIVVCAVVCVAIVCSSCVGVNLTKKSWSDAFDTMHADVSRQYPFTEHKQIDWDALYSVTAPVIMDAEARQDKSQYYMALRNYTFSIHDKHVALAGKDFGLIEKNSGAGFGFGIVKLDDSRYIAHVVLADKAAERAGMQWGAEITYWNNEPVDRAVKATSIVWAEGPQGTKQGHFLEQCRYMLRAPVGETASVTFINPGETDAETVTLTAENDDNLHLDNTTVGMVPKKSFVKSPIQGSMVAPGIGYIKIVTLMPNFFSWRLNNHMKKALKKAMKKGAKSIIIDMRGNQGGIDKLAADIAGYFYKEKSFYEYISYYNADVDSFVINPEQTLFIEPQEPYFDGPVAVLVDMNTVSSGEGIPLALQRLENCVVVGQHSTCGSFGMSTFGTIYRLPEGVVFAFFEGRSLDKNKRIQVDADEDGIGGIVPDIRVPVAYDLIVAQQKNGEDVILNQAIEYLNTAMEEAEKK